MRNTESEFELVLGNRQLLSGFFVVALLFGVAFAMGYIVGRNSIPSPKAQAEAATPASGAAGSQDRPQPAPPESRPADPQPQAPADDATAAAGTQPAAEPEPTTQAAKDGPAAAAPEPTEARLPAPAAPAGLAEPEPGTYWQVTAIAQPQAELLAKVLRDKGFRVLLTQGTKNLTRVLVGPYPDRESLGRAKSDLERSGFHAVILKKE
jgi:cell division septation protein DedD